MMAIVARIAAVSYLDTLPFLYGLSHEGNLRAELLLSSPSDSVLAFASGRADFALVPADAVPSLPGARIVSEYCIGAAPAERPVLESPDAPDATLRATLFPASASGFAPRTPFAYAVWVGREDASAELTEAFDCALTFGLERSYEALVEAGRSDADYCFVSKIDYIFDNQKHKALHKFWDAGLKVTPRANPG